ncbi:MAG: glycosyltransferase [bacterium]
MPDIIFTLLLISILMYLLQTLFILVGTYKLRYPKGATCPKISILVALRDEEDTLEDCVESLLRLDYPTDSIEVVLVNDRSSDRTPALIEKLKATSSRIKTLHIDKGIPGLSGKANAIAQGMDHCSGELILVTDGDCRVPLTWAKTHAAYFQSDVGLVGGFTLLDEKNDQTQLFGKVQSLDWAYLLSVGTGFMGFGLPLSVLGNNFSFRREAYEEVGGYRNMGFTIIEDFALMKTLLKKTSWKVLYPIDVDMLVYSRPMASFHKFYEQRKRWSAGGKEVSLYGKFLMLISVATHLLVPAAFLSGNPAYALMALALIFLADFRLLMRTTGLVKRHDLLKYFFHWEVFYFAYTIAFTPVLLFPTTVKWKAISYTWKLNWKLRKMTE